MTGPTIRVSADVAGVEKELDKLRAKTEKIGAVLSSGEVGIDTRDAKADLEELEASAKSLIKLLDRAKESGDDLTGVDFDSVTESLGKAAKAAGALDQILDAVGQSSGMSATVRNAKLAADHIQRAARAQEILSREGIKLSRNQADSAKQQFDRWRQSGARGTTRIKSTEFDDWLSGGWRNYSMDEGEARRHRADVLRSVGVDTPKNQQEKDAAREKRNRMLSTAASAAGGAIAGTMSGGGLGLGSLAGGAAGMIPGAGMFLGPIAGAIGGMLDRGMERAGQEGGDLTDLRHSVGATTIDFEMLRGSVRHFNEGLGITYNEAAKLARSFAHTATNAEGMNIGREVGSAVGYGRGYGISPEASVQFFANMRQYGVTNGDRDGKRLALQIAESVQRGGTSAKMDEVLSAIQGFVQTSTRASLSHSNAESYASFMASLTGLSMPGMRGDPANAANVMNKADAAMRQGGMFGEASHNLSLGAYQNLFGNEFNAIDAKLINEQGAFNDLGKSFDNMISMAEDRGDSAEADRYRRMKPQGKGRTALSVNMDFVERQFGHLGTTGFAEAGANHFGMGLNEFTALYKGYKSDKGLGGLESTLRASGIDINTLNPKQISSLAELSTADGTGLRNQGSKLLKQSGSEALSRPEADKLRDAMSGSDPDALRRVVMEMTAKHGSMDQGERMRQQQADMNNAMQKLATELIPLTMTMKDGVLALVSKIAPESPLAAQANNEKSAVENYRFSKVGRKGLAGEMIDDPNSADMQKLRADSIAELRRAKENGMLSAEGQRILDAEDAATASPTSERTQGTHQLSAPAPSNRGDARKARKGMRLTPEELSYLSETDKLLKVPQGTSAAQIQVESGNDPEAVSPRGAWGLGQIMPRERAEMERRMGRKIVTRMDMLEAHRLMMQENIGKFGNAKDAQRAYNGGWDRQKWSNPETTQYAESIEATRRDSAAANYGLALTDDGKLPPGAAPGLKNGGSAQRHDIRIDNRVTVQDQNGNEKGGSVVQTQVGAPVPAGAS
ncbi:MAG: transglycosylase SLT domain-containing protein [Fluviibacter phosphoraccumulans]